VADLNNIYIYIYNVCVCVFVCLCVFVFVFMFEDNTEVDQRISSWRSELGSLDSEYCAI
jgi:hypothetical protein